MFLSSATYAIIFMALHQGVTCTPSPTPIAVPTATLAVVPSNTITARDLSQGSTGHSGLSLSSAVVLRRRYPSAPKQKTNKTVKPDRTKPTEKQSKKGVSRRSWTSESRIHISARSVGGGNTTLDMEGHIPHNETDVSSAAKNATESSGSETNDASE